MLKLNECEKERKTLGGSTLLQNPTPSQPTTLYCNKNHTIAQHNTTYVHVLYKNIVCSVCVYIR